MVSYLQVLRDTCPVLLILDLRITIFEEKLVCVSAKHNGIDKGAFRQVNVADTRGHRLRRTELIGHWHSGRTVGSPYRASVAMNTQQALTSAIDTMASSCCSCCLTAAFRDTVPHTSGLTRQHRVLYDPLVITDTTITLLYHTSC